MKKIKKKGLGRGLKALFGDEKTTEKMFLKRLIIL